MAIQDDDRQLTLGFFFVGGSSVVLVLVPSLNVLLVSIQGGVKDTILWHWLLTAEDIKSELDDDPRSLQEVVPNKNISAIMDFAGGSDLIMVLLLNAILVSLLGGVANITYWQCLSTAQVVLGDRNRSVTIGVFSL